MGNVQGGVLCQRALFVVLKSHLQPLAGKVYAAFDRPERQVHFSAISLYL